MQSSRLSILLCLLVSLSFAFAACGDDSGGGGTPGTSDTSQTTTTDTSNTNNNTTGTTGSETTGGTTGTGTTGTTGGPTGGAPLEEGAGDFANCLSGCDNNLPTEIDLATTEFTSVRGQIGSTWSTANGGTVGDVDILSLRAPARSHVRLTLSAQAGSAFEPLINVSDGAKGITFSSEAGTTVTEFIFPFVAETIAMQAIIEDTSNYNNFPNGPFGENLPYELTWEVTPYNPINLGNIAAGETVSPETTALNPGEMRVYTFRGETGETPTVTLEGNNDPNFWPIILPLTTIAGQAVYEAVDCTSQRLTQTVQWDPTEIQDNEYIFVVYECAGDGDPNFTYTLTVNGG